MEFTEIAWNSPSSVQFMYKHGIHEKDMEFTEVAWNSRSSVESAGVFLVMWGVLGDRSSLQKPLGHTRPQARGGGHPQNDPPRRRIL